MAALRVGDPRRRETDIGPLARAELVTVLEAQVEASIAAGARRLAGGARLAGPGFFYAPTVLVNTGPGMPVFDQETFGPVAAVARARDAQQQAGADHGGALASDERQCLRGPRAQGHAYADLAGSLRDGIGQHAVQTEEAVPVAPRQEP